MSIETYKKSSGEALGRWLAAVKSRLPVQFTAEDYAGAWELCRDRFEDLFKAAFGVVPQETEDEAREAALAQFSTVSNRICRGCGCTFDEAWQAARELLPQIYNRMAGREIERGAGAFSDEKNREFASKLLNRLVRAEQLGSGSSHQDAFSVITNRHPGLAGFVDGRALLSDALRQEPGLALRFREAGL